MTRFTISVLKLPSSVSLESISTTLTLITFWASSANDKLVIFFLFFLENRFCHFMQVVSNGDNLHEMLNSFSGKNKKNILKCRLLIFTQSAKR